MSVSLFFSLILLLPFLTSAQKKEYFRNNEWNCNFSQWPDQLLSDDGFLELRCHALKTPFCDEVDGSSTCSPVWRARCPPKHYVNGIRGYFVGRKRELHYEVRCCTHPVLNSKYYKGEISRGLPAGDQMDSVATNRGGQTMQYLANMYSTQIYDHQRIKIGTIQCDDKTSTTRSTPTTRKQRTRKRTKATRATKATKPPRRKVESSKQVDSRPTPDNSGKTGDTGSGTGSSVGACFTADSLVQTLSGRKTMEELEVGDKVLSTAWHGMLPSYVPVVHFLHRDLNVLNDFLTIQTTSGHNVSLSAKHLLPIFPCDRMPADVDVARAASWLSDSSHFAQRASRGLCVLVHFPNKQVKPVPIQSVSKRQTRGIFSPVTASGTIVVNQIQTSCYSSVENHFLQHGFFGTAYGVTTIINNVLEWILSLFTNCPMSHESGDVPVIVQMILSITDTLLGGY